MMCVTPANRAAVMADRILVGRMSEKRHWSPLRQAQFWLLMLASLHSVVAREALLEAQRIHRAAHVTLHMRAPAVGANGASGSEWHPIRGCIHCQVRRPRKTVAHERLVGHHLPGHQGLERVARRRCCARGDGGSLILASGLQNSVRRRRRADDGNDDRDHSIPQRYRGGRIIRSRPN
eukprot:3777273-Prymnesium_polylepis.1